MMRALPAGHGIAGYEVVAPLAEGGQATVYRVREPGSARELALKVLTYVDAAARDRHVQEARLLTTLRHPNLPLVHAVGELAGGSPYVVMELIDGRDLRRAVAESGPLSLEEAARVLAAVARAADHAHAHGVVHRDIKPGNVLVEARTGRAVLIDFGLALRDPGKLRMSTLDERGRLTQDGETVGTPAYMAPEQVDPSFGEVGPATDVYALGATLFTLLTGRLPFEGATAMNLMVAVTSEAPPDLLVHRPDLPPAVAALCARTMAKRPQDRPPSAAAFADELAAVAGPPGAGVTGATGHRLVAALALGAVAAVGLAVMALVASAPDTATAPTTTHPPTPTGAAPPPPPLPPTPEDEEDPAEEPGVSARAGWPPPLDHLTGAWGSYRCRVLEYTAVMSVSPDGRWLLTGGSTYRAQLWDQATGQELGTLPASGQVLAIAWSADAKRVVLGDTRGGVTLCRSIDPSDPKVAWLARPTRGAPRVPVLAVHLAADGTTLAFRKDGALLAWAEGAGEPDARRRGGESYVAGAFSADGERLVAVAEDGTVHLVMTLPGTGRRVDAVSDVKAALFSASGHLALVPREGEVARCVLHDIAREQGVADLVAGAGPAGPIARARGSIAVSGGAEVRVWSESPAKVEAIIPQPRLGALAFTPDGARLWTASEDGALRAWDLSTTKPRPSLGPEVQVGLGRALDVLPDGSRALCGFDQGDACVWDLVAGTRESLAVPDVIEARFAGPRGDRCVLLTEGDRNLLVHEGGRQRPVATGVLGFALADPSTIVYSTRAEGLVALDLATGTSQTISDHRGPAVGFADGRCVIRVGEEVHRHDLRGGAWSASPLPVSGAARVFAWARHGRMAVANDTGQVFVEGVPGPFKAQGQPVIALAFSADGRRLATCGWDNDIRVWTLSEGAVKRTGRIRLDGVADVAGRLAFDDRGRLYALTRRGALLRFEVP